MVKCSKCYLLDAEFIIFIVLLATLSTAFVKVVCLVALVYQCTDVCNSHCRQCFNCKYERKSDLNNALLQIRLFMLQMQEKGLLLVQLTDT